MGKSPGRWIKTVLFGKKHSKSSLSKNAKHGKKDAAKASSEDLSGNSNPNIITDEGAENLELENSTSGIQCATGTSLPVNVGVESQSVSVTLPISDAEMRIQGQAATKVQAAFRGYLARRAFRALKGIIRLQAVIRGHLVRRQAVATLRCMQAVVKLQALARGRRVRLSGTWPGIHRKYNIGELQDVKQAEIGATSLFISERQAANAYIRKLVLSLPTATPLSLQYELAEPNSAWNWLERWSLSCFWELPTRPGKVLYAKPHRKYGGSQPVGNDSGKSRRTIRKASVAGNGDNGVLASIEMDKPKRNPRKAKNDPTDSIQEQPQNELEKVKRSLRKVSVSSTAAASEKSEMETLKPPGTKTVINSATPNALEKEIVTPDPNVVEKQVLIGAPSTAITTEVLVDIPYNDHPLVESHSLENGATTDTTLAHEETGSREDDSSKDSQKVRKRRSLSAKQEFAENISQNTPTLPSYMAATKSAKAKLRAQGSARCNEDGVEQGYIRRHSLPAYTNGKLSSMSPRMQKVVQANGKGSSKTNRSVSSSRDEKVLQPGWRR